MFIQLFTEALRPLKTHVRKREKKPAMWVCVSAPNRTNALSEFWVNLFILDLNGCEFGNIYLLPAWTQSHILYVLFAHTRDAHCSCERYSHFIWSISVAKSLFALIARYPLNVFICISVPSHRVAIHSSEMCFKCVSDGAGTSRFGLHENRLAAFICETATSDKTK